MPRQIILKPTGRMTAQEIEFLKSLPPNLPISDVQSGDIKKIAQIYYKYIAGNPALSEATKPHTKQKHKGGEKFKLHEMQRDLLNCLASIQSASIDYDFLFNFIRDFSAPAYTAILREFLEIKDVQ